MKSGVKTSVYRPVVFFYCEHWKRWYQNFLFNLKFEIFYTRSVPAAFWFVKLPEVAIGEPMHRQPLGYEFFIVFPVPSEILIFSLIPVPESLLI